MVTKLVSGSAHTTWGVEGAGVGQKLRHRVGARVRWGRGASEAGGGKGRHRC